MFKKVRPLDTIMFNFSFNRITLIMIWLYRALFLPLLLLSSPYYLRRMLKRGGYGKSFHHRFGLMSGVPLRRNGVKRIWIQAVSVGELLAIDPLLRLLSKDERYEVVLTTTTSTGFTLALERYSSIAAAIGIFPLDFWLFSVLAWKRIKPDMAILMEGERWPEHIYQARSRGVPIALINARISDRSFARYYTYSFVCEYLLYPLNLILAATEQDYDRLITLGVNPEKMIMSGNLKLDIEIQPRLKEEAILSLTEELGFTNHEKKKPDSKYKPLILLGSSTWPGEELAILHAFEDVLNEGIDCRLLIVPRHAERRKEIKSLLERQSLPFHFRTMNKKAPHSVMIYVADTTGELVMLTQPADLVFIGKSLPPHDGGQTPIESAALGKPILFGPQTSNFRLICNNLEETGAAKRVNDVDELRKVTVALLKSNNELIEMAENAKQWDQDNQGATERTLGEIRKLLSDPEL